MNILVEDYWNGMLIGVVTVRSIEEMMWLKEEQQAFIYHYTRQTTVWLQQEMWDIWVTTDDVHDRWRTRRLPRPLEGRWLTTDHFEQMTHDRRHII